MLVARFQNKCSRNGCCMEANQPVWICTVPASAHLYCELHVNVPGCVPITLRHYNGQLSNTGKELTSQMLLRFESGFRAFSWNVRIRLGGLLRSCSSIGILFPITAAGSMLYYTAVISAISKLHRIILLCCSGAN